MLCSAKYNPWRDLKKVDPTGYFDLSEAYRSGSIPATVPDSEERFNNIDDPRSIGARPRDRFEAAQAHVAIVGYKAPQSSDAPAEE